MTLKRSSAAIIALGVFCTITLRIWLRMDQNGTGLSETLWVNYRFFTLWTNTLVGIACASIAFGGRVSPKMFSGLLLSISIVAIVYHALLAHLQDFSGIDLFIDHMLHTFVPLGVVLYWLCFVAKSGMRYKDIPPWLVLPLVYCIYAMVRAEFDGIYPYFFLNLAKLGLIQTSVNIIGLLFVFLLFGAIFVFVGRQLHRLGLSR